MSTAAGAWPELAQQLASERDLAGRGIVVLLDLGAHDVSEDAVVAALGPTRILRPDATDAQLSAVNHQRDVLLQTGTSVVFLLRDHEAARRVFRLTPDLTALVDLTLELRPPTHLTQEAFRDRLRLCQTDLHGVIDLTGLVPHNGEGVRLPIDEVYLRAAGLPEDLSLEKPVLAVGPPGAGKTTTLRWMSWTHAQQRPGSPVPDDRTTVYVPLARWAAELRDGTTLLLPFLERYLGSLLGVDTIPLGEHLASVALLLDGLDEVPSLAERRALLEQAAELHTQGALVIVSGRDHVLDDLRRNDHTHWKVERWQTAKPHQARDLVVAILQARGVAMDVAKQIARDLANHQDFRLFTTTPLLLTFLVVLSSMQREVPTQRAELYHDLIEMLISSWRRLRTHDHRTLRRGEVLRVVAPLGWHLVAQGVGGLTEPELLTVLRDLEQRTTPDPAAALTQAQQRLDQLRSDTALLQTTDGLWRFNHPTIAEYLAAEALLQDPAKLQQLADQPYAQEWSQVLAFALAISIDITPRDDVAGALMDALEKRARRAGVYDAKIPRTLALCLRETPGMPAHRRVAFAEHMLRIALKQRLSMWARLDALAALTKVDWENDPSLRSVLNQWLCNPKSWLSKLALKPNARRGLLLLLESLDDWHGFDFTPLCEALASETSAPI